MLNRDVAAGVACSFLVTYYREFVKENDMAGLFDLYADTSVLTYAQFNEQNPDVVQGRHEIVQNLAKMDLELGRRKVEVRFVDYVPLPGSCVQIVCQGVLYLCGRRCPFSQVFVLAPTPYRANTYHIASDYFRVLGVEVESIPENGIVMTPAQVAKHLLEEQERRNRLEEQRERLRQQQAAAEALRQRHAEESARRQELQKQQQQQQQQQQRGEGNNASSSNNNRWDRGERNDNRRGERPDHNTNMNRRDRGERNDNRRGEQNENNTNNNRGDRGDNKRYGERVDNRRGDRADRAERNGGRQEHRNEQNGERRGDNRRGEHGGNARPREERAVAMAAPRSSRPLRTREPQQQQQNAPAATTETENNNGTNNNINRPVPRSRAAQEKRADARDEKSNAHRKDNAPVAPAAAAAAAAAETEVEAAATKKQVKGRNPVNKGGATDHVRLVRVPKTVKLSDITDAVNAVLGAKPLDAYWFGRSSADCVLKMATSAAVEQLVQDSLTVLESKLAATKFYP
ncbi:hypothetical protein DQ04_02151040 [Trypanosoma grayi]|uniref:hypothetical protein n=1 Tax=Trypanosoma grayi TaxID=71804 RepID=UPI0004F464A8|nr:hypothetical protein DQ04_02151040 [Trypanosoma grayi]KEG11915.1 hypothetical protein DQ04_02151040 [Trypanosoma grayi]